MSDLKFETITMPGAELGPENPLPAIRLASADRQARLRFDESIPEKERPLFLNGHVASILPYTMQDGYTRDRKVRDYPCVTLENEFLRARFFPQFGGKLWSLYDKEHDRELLHKNPVFQPANIALRNAWTSGGTEWNMGIMGHNPFTLSPLFAAQTSLSDGTPVLRMYEWERIRRASYQIDAFLPDGSRFLYVRVRIKNTSGGETPMYWWSNTAVEETPNVRVVTPADTAIANNYTDTIRVVPIPVHEGIDKSYSARAVRAFDFFFLLPDAARKWEAALDENGEGLIQTSTDRLKGRKLFMWGAGQRGRKFQEILTVKGRLYNEIQAGLAHSQGQYLPMPKDAVWEWLEAYGMMRADPGKVHDGDYHVAYTHVGEKLERQLPRRELDDLLARIASDLSKPAKLFQTGSGWAALELMRLGRQDNFDGEAAIFGRGSLSAEQEPWIELLEKGTFPDRKADQTPAAFHTQKEWIDMLEKAVNNGSGNWHALLHLGIMYSAHQQYDKARLAFNRSLEKTPNAWAKRNLAALSSTEAASAEADNNKEKATAKRKEAAALMKEAAALLPIKPIMIEYAKALSDAGMFAEYVTLFDNLPEEYRGHGRLRLLRAKAAAMTDDFDLGIKILTGGIEVVDLAEGETSLTDLWITLHARKIAKAVGIPVDDDLKTRALAEYPIPPELDFQNTST